MTLAYPVPPDHDLEHVAHLRALAAQLGGSVLSEWTKLRSLRSTVWGLVASIAVGIGLGAVFCAGFAAHYTAGVLPTRDHFDPTSFSLSGLVLGQLAIAVLGVLTVTSEYATGLMRTTLSAVPKRGLVLAAKAIVFTLVTLVIGTATSFGAFLLGQQILEAKAPHAALSDPGVLRAVAGGGLYLALIGLLGVFIGVLVRHTSTAITVVVIIAFVTPIIADLLPGEWRQIGQRWLPTNAGAEIYSVVHDAQALSPWSGFGVLAAWTAVFGVGAWGAMRHRPA